MEFERLEQQVTLARLRYEACVAALRYQRMFHSISPSNFNEGQVAQAELNLSEAAADLADALTIYLEAVQER
jgi:hypothetical protein